MKKIIIVLFLFCNIHAMEDIPGMYPPTDFVALAREKLAKDGNVYVPEPVSKDAPLTPELVLNPYWRAMQKRPQEEKDEALKKILTIYFSDPGYFLERYHLAAAALIGANVNMSPSLYSPLRRAVEFQDVSLCALLLTQPGTDPNWREHDRANMPFLYVKKVFLAQLFLNAGANLTLRGALGSTYLHWAMGDGYEPGLIKLCIAHGIDPLVEARQDCTPLHQLILYAYHHTIPDLKEKVDYLLEPLNESTKELIKSVEKLIERKSDQANVQWLNNYLQAKISTQKIS